MNAIGKHQVKKRRKWPIWEKDFVFILLRIWRKITRKFNLRWRLNFRASFEPTKCRIIIHLLNQNLQKMQKWQNMLENDCLKLFYLRLHLNKKIKILEYFSYKLFINLLVFQILSFKNAVVCVRVHLIEVKTVRCIQTWCSVMADRFSGFIHDVFCLHFHKKIP